MAFNTHVRPILKYATVTWSSVLKQDTRKLEGVQKRFTKRLSGMVVVVVVIKSACQHQP